VRTNGDEVKARVLLVSPAEVTYIPSVEPLSTDTLRIAASEVFMIQYANGTKALVHNPAAPDSGLERTAADLTNQGRMDAQKYFKAPGSLFVTATATAASLILFGPTTLGALGGIATGAAIAASPVQDQNYIVPDKELLNNPNYLIGYDKQAQRKKIGKATAGFGVGFVSGAAIWLAIALANTNHF
jgi:hypothetical protein